MAFWPWPWGVRYRTSIAITVYLHMVLWGSLAALIIVMDIFTVAYMDVNLRPSAVLLLLSSLLSMIYITFHNITAKRRTQAFKNNEPGLHVKRPSYIAIRLAVTVSIAWLITSGWSLIIAARQPVCLPGGSIIPYWQAGGPCVAQRFGTFVSIVVLISSCALFISISISHDPFKSHLLGTSRDPTPQLFQPTSSMFTIPIPKPTAYEKQTSAHSRSNSNTSLTSETSIPATDAISSRPLSPISSGPAGLGMFSAMDLPVQPPMSSGVSNPISRPATAYSVMSRPLTSHSTTSLGNYPYQHHRRNHSMTSLPGFTPMTPLLRPTPPALSDSAWRAVHPPAYQFRHVSNPYGPASRPGTAIGPSTLRALPNASSLSLSGSRTPSLHSGWAGYAYHNRSQSNGFVPMPPTRGSSRSSSSGGSFGLPRSGLSHMRCASDPDKITTMQRAADMDLAVRLERKLAEVQQRLERQKSQSQGSDSAGSSGTMEGIEREIEGLGVGSGMEPMPLMVRKSRSAVDLVPRGRLGMHESFELGESRKFGSAGILRESRVMDNY